LVLFFKKERLSFLYLHGLMSRTIGINDTQPNLRIQEKYQKCINDDYYCRQTACVPGSHAVKNPTHQQPFRLRRALFRKAPLLPSRGKPIVNLVAMLSRLKQDRRAVTALEYGIIAGVLGLVLITIFKSFGTTLTKLFATIGASV